MNERAAVANKSCSVKQQIRENGFILFFIAPSSFLFFRWTMSSDTPSFIHACDPYIRDPHQMWTHSLLLLLLVTVLSILPSSTTTAMALSAKSSSSSFIDKLAWIVLQNRRQLVVRSHGKTVFFTPGGKRETGETDIQALIRECHEELTVHLIPETIQPYGVFEAPAFGKDHTRVRMTCYTAAYTDTLKASSEIEELQWIDSHVDPDSLTESGVLILKDLLEKGLVD